MYVHIFYTITIRSVLTHFVNFTSIYWELCKTLFVQLILTFTFSALCPGCGTKPFYFLDITHLSITLQQFEVCWIALSHVIILHSFNLLSSATPELVTAPATSQPDLVDNEAQATSFVALDTSQPVTNIQIRLADGGRLVQKFNHTHRWFTLRLKCTESSTGQLNLSSIVEAEQKVGRPV